MFRLWPQGLPSELDLCAIQLPGRTMRLSEPPIANIPVLAEAVVAAIAPHLELPFAFFGHSMGALLATEVAHGLAGRGLPQPRSLIVSGRRPPRMPPLHSPLSGLSDAEFVDAISRRYGGIPPEILADADVLSLLLPALRADIRALESHVPPVRQPLRCPIVAFSGADDALTPIDHLDGWRTATDAAFDLRIFPGGHFFIESERAAVLAQLSAILAPLVTRAEILFT